MNVVGQRSSFFGHPLAIYRLKLTESQVAKLKSTSLVKASMMLEAVSKTKFLNPNTKKKVDLGIPYATVRNRESKGFRS